MHAKAKIDKAYAHISLHSYFASMLEDANIKLRIAPKKQITIAVLMSLLSCLDLVQ